MTYFVASLIPKYSNTYFYTISLQYYMHSDVWIPVYCVTSRERVKCLSVVHNNNIVFPATTTTCSFLMLSWQPWDSPREQCTSCMCVVGLLSVRFQLHNVLIMMINPCQTCSCTIPYRHLVFTHQLCLEIPKKCFFGTTHIVDMYVADSNI